MGECVKRLSHVDCNNSTADVVVAVLDCFDYVYEAFLSEARVIKALLSSATYTVNDFVQSVVYGSRIPHRIEN